MVVKRRNRCHPNWPLLLVVFLFGSILMAAWLGSTWLSILGLGSLSKDRLHYSHLDTLLMTRAFDVLVGVWFFAVSASIASFLNVVAYRLPLNIPLTGYSRCPYCMQAIRGHDNIPVFGWFKLRGRCRDCRLPISFRYPGYELLGGLVGVAIYLIEVISHGNNVPFAEHRQFPYAMLTGSIDWQAILFSLYHLVAFMYLLASAMTRWSGATAPPRLFATGIILAWLGNLLSPWNLVPNHGFFLTNAGLDPPDILPWLHLAPLIDSMIGTFFGLAIGTSFVFITASSADLFLLGKPAKNFRTAWVLSLAFIGACWGWQSVLSIGLMTIGLGLLISLTSLGAASKSSHYQLADPLAWFWLASLMHVATWSIQSTWPWWPQAAQLESKHLVAVIAMAVVAFALRQLASLQANAESLL